MCRCFSRPGRIHGPSPYKPYAVKSTSNTTDSDRQMFPFPFPFRSALPSDAAPKAGVKCVRLRAAPVYVAEEFHSIVNEPDPSAASLAYSSAFSPGHHRSPTTTMGFLWRGVAMRSLARAVFVRGHPQDCCWASVYLDRHPPEDAPSAVSHFKRAGNDCTLRPRAVREYG